MCTDQAAAEETCFKKYGHRSAAEPDFRPDGHLYASIEDLEWIVHPMDDNDGPGVTGIRPGAKPLCQLAT